MADASPLTAPGLGAVDEPARSEVRVRTAARELPPRVLMVLKRDLGGGGMQQQARRVSLTLRQSGIPVTLISQAQHPGRHRRSYARYLPTTFLYATHQWSFAAALFRYLLRYRAAYDVVHAHGFGLEAVAAIIARRFTGKAVVVKPSTAGRGTKLDVYARWTRWCPPLAWTLWQTVDAWISISEQTRADLLRMRVAPQHIAEIPNGVDGRFRPLPARERAALRKELGLGPDDVLIVTAARLTPHKRVDLLLRAFLQIAAAHPEARLWVMGDGEQAGELRSLVEGHPGRDQVRLMGRVLPSELLRVYQAADVFALFSLWEGLSNSLLEAMACGLAPVVTGVSGMADVVADGATGLLIPPDDEAAAVLVLETLARSAEQRQELGQAASQHIEAGYRIQRTAERLVKVYRSCLGRR